MRRVGVFCFFDPAGIVDNYIIYLLKALRPYLSHLVIVSNGELLDESYKKLEIIADDILIRENIGFDAWAYKEGIEYLGFEALKDYDELLLFNGTNFGPIFPLNDVFDMMEARNDLDFWGITQYPQSVEGLGRSVGKQVFPAHIQSYWIAIRKTVLDNKIFQNYWRHFKPINSYQEAIVEFETKFTQFLSDEGFRWGTYLDTDDLKLIIDNPTIFLPADLIQKKRAPFIKRRAFFEEYSTTLNISLGNQLRDAFDFIKNYTEYDINLIWDNLLRTAHMSDIKDNLHLNYILSETVKIRDKKNEAKVGLIMHIYYEDQIAENMNYIHSMPIGTNVLITTDTIEKEEQILLHAQNLSNYQISTRLVLNRGRDVGAFLVEGRSFAKEYDYICFVHDKKTTQIKPGLIGLGFSYRCFEGILRNKIFVENILATFEENQRLGLLCPPPPNHSIFYRVLGNEWCGNFEPMQKLLKQLGIKVPISTEKAPVAPLGSMFWFRVEALKPLLDFDWKYEDFPEEPIKGDGTLPYVIERVHPFIAQSMGYYSGWVFPQSLAEVELTNLTTGIRAINSSFDVAFKFQTIKQLQKRVQKLVKWKIFKNKCSLRYWKAKFRENK